MIFVNRHRIIQNSGAIKDPTTYWYVEKYVYGVLKETLEIPLGTSTAFTSIDSGYDDDNFYGWSISSTSTTRTFNNTTSYSNTTTAVKNNLDENNTLKLYAVYKYYKTDGADLTSFNDSTSSSIYTREFYVSKSGYFYFKGNTHNTGTSINGGVNTYSSINIKITGNTNNTISTPSDGSTAISTYIESGSVFSFDMVGGNYKDEYANVDRSSNIVITSGSGGIFKWFSGMGYRVISHA